MAHFLTGLRTRRWLAAGAALRSAWQRLGNDGAVANVRTDLMATAEARVAVDQLAWRVAAADRAARLRPPAPATPHAA
jgi:hypothetical protein